MSDAIDFLDQDQEADGPAVELEWSAPSGRATASGATASMANRLRQRPNEWAIIEAVAVPDDAEAAKKARAQMSNRASLISQGRIAAFTPRGAYEAASRSKNQKDAEGNPVIRVYARYLGQEGIDAMAKADAEKAAAKEAKANAAQDGGQVPTE